MRQLLVERSKDGRELRRSRKVVDVESVEDLRRADASRKGVDKVVPINVAVLVVLHDFKSVAAESLIVAGRHHNRFNFFCCCHSLLLLVD